MLEMGLINMEINYEKNHSLMLSRYQLCQDHNCSLLRSSCPFVLQDFLMQVHTVFSLCGHPYLHAKFHFVVWHINTGEGLLIKVQNKLGLINVHIRNAFKFRMTYCE